ncbi:Ig-like domain-containing protein, partial [uncultured Intestinimonas sp.]|uniref:Ig-like domain-containing protein n=1 Tax=uncultured Intestinimonas sp. TaxID=1689265 RepID=UPI0026112F1F
MLALAMCAGMVPSAAMAAEAEPAPVQEEELLTASSQSGREVINFNPDWRFNLGDASGAEARNYDDSDWRELDLPHDYSIEQDFTQDVDVNSGALPGGVGWYRKTFVLPADMAGKNISIEFGGVYMDSTTYVNGQLVGNYPYGYSPFAYDITDLVVADGVTENVIAVRVNNQLPSSRWYSGSGIYRNVKMVVTDPVHVARYGTYVTTPDLESEYAQDRATVNVKTEVENEGTEDVSAVVTSTILDAEGNIFAESASTEPQTIAVGETVEFDQDITTDQPALWSVDDPNLYTMETTVTVDGEVVDTYSTTFGFRWIEVTNNDGFYLNGEYMKLNGVCMHHDQGALGAVANYRAIERQMETMKEMGVNAIRVTHNPAADELLEICDRLGLMVIDEAFDCWEAAKRTYDYHRFFDQVSTHPDAEPGETWAEFDIKNMVERGKNDPCVIMWSLGNEIVSASVETAKKLNGWVKEVDDTRPTFQGFNNFIGSFSDSYMKRVADVPDIAGFNYGENGSNPSYDQAHVEYPDWIIIGSETSSAVRSRGYYYRDNNKHIISSYDDGNTVGWGSSMEHAWQMNRDRKWILGEFMWTGFDYIGEPSPLGSWPSKSSYFGAVDTAGIPKDAFYMYQSVWTSVEEDPMVHLLPHWNWEGDAGYDIQNADGEIAVQAYSNAPSVELFLNGESLGRQDFDQLETEDGRPYQEKDGHIYLQWMVPYEPGELKAVAYDEDDNVIATDVIRTSGEPAQIRLTPDREIITADGEDLSYILVEVLDEDGDLVPTADDLVNFQVSGNGVIAGVDNGDQTAVDERYKDNKRKAFSGKAMLIVQSTDTAGSISITASSAGLTSDSVTVFTTTDESGSELLGYEALPEVVTAVDTQPELPATVTAVYSNGSKEEMAISWDEIDGSLLAEGGMFTTSGTVVETGDRVSVTVVVAEYLGLRDAYIVTAVGTVPALPETVTAVYNTGDTTQLPVIWERTLTEADVAAAGTVTVEGSVEGFSDPARAVIEVRESEVVYDVDIAQRDGTYPIPTASYINSGDPVEAINNGAVYHSGGPAGERWIPWNHGEVTEWCQLELEEAAEIGKVGIDIWNNATDGAMSLPDTLTIQYSNDGEEWIDIASKTGDELDAVDGSMDGLATAEVVFDFSDTPVNARFIRWKFDNAARKSTGVGEVHVYSNQIKLDVSSVAQLEGIQIGGEALEGFDPATYNYTVEIPYGADVPEITAAAAENGSVYVIPAMGPGRSATILVTAEDGETTATYSIFFQVAAPVLDQVEVSIEGGSALTEDDVKTVDLTAMLQDGTVLSDDVIDVTYIVGDENIIQVHDGQVYAYNAGETTLTARVTYQDVTVESEPLTVTVEATTENKTIIGYEQVNVTTDKGVAPELPSRIMATFDKGLAKDVDVVWDEIPESDYADYGVFTVRGTVAGQALRPTATVVVKGVVGVQQFSTAIPVRFIPTLPARANVYYSDGTMDQRPITWEECTQDMFTEAGEVVTVSGEVDGMPTQMVVRVSDQGSYNENDSFIAYRNGFYLPLPFASFSNLAGSPLDSVGNIYDNQITQDETQTPKSIWSNWVSDPRPGDYVGVVFGYEDVTEKTLDRLDVYYFHDFGTTAPASVQIQYYVGEDFIQDDLPQDPIDDLDADHFLADDANWADVEDQVTVQGEPQLEGVTTYTFDAVQTCAIRLVMENQEGMAIGISEIRAYDKNVDDISGEAALANIYLDGEPLEGFASDTYTYTYELSDNALPEVTVETSGNNESATVIGPVLSTGTDSASVCSIQILVTSEDGATSHTYEIQFTAPDTGDQDAVAAAKAVVESGSYTVAQSTANDEAAVKTWLTGKLNSDLIGTGVTVTEADITIQSIVPAVAGTEEAPDGTDGGFTFTVALAKGEASAVTGPVTGTIAATNAVRTYTVTFDSMGGTAVEPQTVDAGGKAAEPADPTRDGYTFDGWYTADGDLYTFTEPVTADLDLYARWIDDGEPEEPDEPDEPDVDEDRDPENASTVVTRPGESGGSGSETPETPDEPGTDI